MSRLEKRSIMLNAAVIFLPLNVCSCLKTMKSTIQTSFGMLGSGIRPGSTTRWFGTR